MQSTQTPGSYGNQGYGDQSDGGRPGSVTTAAVIHLVFGVIVILFGVLFALSGAVLQGSGLGPFGEAAAGIALVLAVILIVFGVLEVISGINLFSGKGWARILSIILAVLGALLAVFFLIAGIAGQSQDPATGATVSAGPNIPVIIGSLVFLIGWIYSIIGVITGGRWFNRG